MLFVLGIGPGFRWFGFSPEMPMLDLPPGIAAQAQPAHGDDDDMQQMGLSLEQMEMMMADMQMMADQLPPGIFLQILRLMSQLDMKI